MRFKLGSPYGACSVFSGGQTEALGSVLTPGAANRGVFLEFAELLDAHA